MKRWLAVVSFLAVAVSFAIAAPPLSRLAGADGIEVKSQTAQNRFPDGVQFAVFATSSAEITSIRLRYRILPDGATVFGKPQCNTGTSVNCSLSVGSSAAAFLVPGVDIIYSWQLEDAAGNKLETQEAKYTYQDDRFHWDSFSEGNVTVFFYSGSDQTNRSLLQAARETLDRMGSVLNAKVEFPVKVWIYATANDMRPAILSNRRIAPNPNNPTTLGEVVYSDTALVSRDSLPLDIVRHEVTHIITRQATKGNLGDTPAWVDEGTSVYAQKQLLPDELSALDIAIKRNRPLSIFSLSSNTLTQTDTSLFYAQSWSMVKYLIDTYGPQKYAQFIAAFKDNTTDGALKKVYGFDQNGFENAWRKSVGLPALTTSGDTQGGREVGIPTIVPFGSTQGQSATPATGAETAPNAQTGAAGGGSGNGLVIAIGAATAVIALFVLGAGVYAARRRKS